ncbi:Acetyltransferase (GNAT) family protein [Asanoa hainanensis]|uniref:Acetyltransferase (GNAT) family protein n=1 Tax=Asanoa hainanensis TaxID=560556 RepID=A0A239MRL5_9ACTN|nr:GNAT family N-acetyltransferase [Asanoa hainanensis]SNT44754.1 Acetyltransferase (GNAT) family protein [Asanoa hainanensis]
MSAIAYEWRGVFSNAELEALHTEGFAPAGPATDVRSDVDRDDWWGRVQRHSLGWVCARLDGALVGFVNVVWDGGAHAFVLDTVVAERAQRQGVGARLVRLATDEARAAGAAWLHVDFEPHLRGFYLDACGFSPTDAGLIALNT